MLVFNWKIESIVIQAVVDGDLCEQFSAIDYAKQKSIGADLVRGPNEVAKKLEDIRNRVM